MLKNDTNELYLNRTFKIVFLFMIFALLMVLFAASRVYAQKLDEIDGGIINDFYYNSSTDEYVIKFNPKNITKITLAFHDNYGSYNVTYQRDFSGLKFSGDFFLTCNGMYRTDFYRDGVLIHREYFNTYSIKSPICDSSVGNDPSKIGEGEGGGGCTCFQTPEWKNLIDTLQGISDKIPPPPNWQQVANTMSDTIVPAMTASLENMLGTAPSPPSIPTTLDITPPQPPPSIPVHDYAGELELDEPSFDDVPGLDEASRFSADDLKSQAPEIQFREDESGGFNIVNPIDNIPKLPYDGFPMPGENAGAWDHQPGQTTNFTPPTTGGGTNYQPPTPGGGTNFEPPIPNNGNVQPPTGSHDEFGWGYYKPHPDAPDGSGGGW